MNRRDRQTLIEGVVMAVSLVVFAVGAVLVHTTVPCSWLGWVPAGQVPARCVMTAGD